MFKILFIGSSAYVIYLMVNDYEPTRDPNIDTFKVQYLLGLSALLAIIFPHDYSISEVSLAIRKNPAQICYDKCRFLTSCFFS